MTPAGRPNGLPAARIAHIQHLVISSLKPIRPLPSNRTLVLVAVVFSIFLAFACTFPFGWFALQALSIGQMTLYYGFILLLLYLLAQTTVEDVIPGCVRTLSQPALIGGAFLLLGLGVALMFPSFTTERFVQLGVPCLRLGVMCAGIAGLFVSLLLRRGFLTSRVKTCCLAGTLAGLVGFGGLAIHCPILQASHILVWHLGAMLVAGVAGSLVGVYLEYRPTIDRRA